MVEYWLNKNGTLQKSQTINITVDADSAYATVCWVGVIRNTDGCIGDDVQNYCESIYIGVNTSCTDDKQSSGTIRWNGCTITYNITQKRRDDCEDCGNCAIFYELIDAYVNPYYVTSDNSATTVYYQYWETRQDECHVISRVRESGSQQVPISPNVDCDAENRTISVPAINISGYTDCRKQTTKEIPISGLYCYVQKPENCCDESGISECYEINDIYYNPQKVDYSGGTVNFYFDYKKITLTDCEKKETYGRHQGTVKVPKCDGSECCRERVRTIPYVWSGHTLCGGGNTINLKITQKKDLNYSGECQCEVEHPDTGYCVSTSSVKRYYKDTVSGTWKEINPLNPYVFPYYGGTMKVSWEYSAITVYENCTSGLTSGNIWEDYIDILPYSGDDCDEGTLDNVSVEYTFKKSPCNFEDDAKAILPSNICSNCTNVFTIQYQQYKKPCSDSCKTCVTKSNIEIGSGGTDTVTDTAICDITLTDKPEWLTVSVNGRNISYSASLNSGSTREGGVTFKLNNEECYDTIIVKQIGSNQDKDEYPKDPTIECDCDNAFFEAYSAQTAMSKNGGEHEFIGSYIFNSCIKDVGISSDCRISYDKEPTCSGGTVTFTVNKGGGSFVSNVSFEDGAIYADIEKNNTSEERTYELPISYTIENCGDGEASIMVKQKKGNDPAPSNISVTFTLVNGTPNEINGTVEIFCDGMSNSFTVPDFTVGSTLVSKVKVLDSTYENASITLAEFQSSAGNKILIINGINVLSDGGTIYLYYNG